MKRKTVELKNKKKEPVLNLVNSNTLWLEAQRSKSDESEETLYRSTADL